MSFWQRLRVPTYSEILSPTGALGKPYLRAALLYFVIVLAVTSPVLLIEHFAVQDGSAHVYNAYLIRKILDGGTNATIGLRLNTLTVPNSTGHWILIGLLEIFTSITAVKILMVAEYAGFVAVLTWLRRLTLGSHGLCTGLLLAAVYGLNFFWFGGFFNFVNGLIGYVLSISIFYWSREKRQLLPNCLIAIILFLTYLSHIVCFGTAVAALFFLAIFSNRGRRLFRVFCVAISAAPSLIAVIIYKLSTESNASLIPAWKWVETSDSLFTYLRNFLVDPFIIISRRTIPFTDLNSSLCVLVSPDLWIFVSVATLVIVTCLGFAKSRNDARAVLPFLLIFGTLTIGGFLAPDNFGEANGSILRERLILCGLCMTVAIFDLRRFKRSARVLSGILTFVLIFQIAAMWEYGWQADKTVREFLPATSVLTKHDQVMTIVNIEDGYRYHSLVDTQLDLLASVDHDWFVWDNYELGYSLFPIITENAGDRQFISDLAVSHVFVENGPAPERERTGMRLERLLASDNHRFTKLIVWGPNDRVATVLYRWFDPIPLFKSDRIIVLRHR